MSAIPAISGSSAAQERGNDDEQTPSVLNRADSVHRSCHAGVVCTVGWQCQCRSIPFSPQLLYGAGVSPTYMTGSGCVILSLLSAFLAWNKRLDPVREFLPNAAGADAAERSGWVAGSTLDTNSYAPSGNPKSHTYIGTFARKQETHRTSVSRRNTSKPPRKESTLSGKTMGSVTRLDQKANRRASAPRREIDWEKDWDKLVARYDLAPSPGERKKSTDAAQTEEQIMYARDAARTSKAEDSTVIRKYERKPRE